MAENAAHLSTSSQTNPTIFEVVAQESLLSSLEASAKILCDVLINKYPDKFGWLRQWYDEVYLGFNCFLQYYYIKNCNGSFSEAFYNLKRAPLHRLTKSYLSKNERFRSLFILVALPYLSEKIKVYLEKKSIENLSTGTEKKVLSQIVLIFKKCQMCYEVLKLIQYLRYMTGSSSTHTPLLNLAGVQLIYQSDTDKRFPDYSWKEIILSLFGKSSVNPNMKSIFIKMFCQGLEFTAFFIQFLKWWQAEDLRSKMSGLPTPEPPKASNQNSLTAKGLCPICQRKRRVEVTLRTSGYVFCYKCILEVLNNTGKCPVTGLPSSMHDLVRVYDTLN